MKALFRLNELLAIPRGLAHAGVWPRAGVLPVLSKAWWIPAVILFSGLTGPAYSQTLDAFDPAPPSTVFALAVQPDGQVLVGGGFTCLCGQDRSRIGRLNPDGTLDTGFNPGASSTVYALAVQTNGGILVGGGFTTLGGQPHSRLGRLNSDGSVDAAFNPVVSNTVACLALQADGKILVGGSWIGINGTTRRFLARLNTDGTLDAAFDPGANSSVMSIAVQPDGGLVVGGNFNTLAGQWANHLGRLNANGSYDLWFNSDADNQVSCLALQPDGKILVGGSFRSLGGSACNYAGRLNPDGSLDSTFGSGADRDVYSLALQTDGKILMGGAFTNLAGLTRNRLGRLNATGTADASFSAPVNAAGSGSVYALALQPDGKVLLGGSFTNIAGQSRTNLGRLNNTGPATQTLSCTGSAVTWNRSGTGPELWRTAFEASTNGADWVSLGAGTRVAGGWQVTGLALPVTASIRARGFVTGGRGNSSSSLIETLTGPPVIATQPASRTNNAGTTASFNVSAVGSGPLGYQWRKNGVPFSDSANVAGSRLPSLTLSNIFGGVRGGYSVVVTNAFGAVTSSVATLTVLDPFILSPPVAQWVNAGDSVTFSATGAGTGPLSYQWRKDGANLAGATKTALELNGVQRKDIGAYEAIVTNPYGNATSSVAVLSINLATCDAFKTDPIYPVIALALQTDGRILFGTTISDFYQMHNCFGRLNPDGSTDTNYDVQVSGVQFQTDVEALALQPDGNLLVGGQFSWIGPQYCPDLGRVSPAGVVSPDFHPGISGMYPFIRCLGSQPDQKLAVAGCFEKLGYSAQTNVGRIDAAGVLDPSFHAGTEEALYPNQGRIYAMALQPDGKIVLGGLFSTLCGQARNHIGRLNADGTLDGGFNPGANATVGCLAVQPDGGILVGGSFTNLGGLARSRLGRLRPDGSLDDTFSPGADSTVATLALQTDGRIIVGGAFTNLAGQPCNRLGRLNGNGSPDTTFNPGADNSVAAVALQADGKLLAGGTFQTLGGQPRTNLGRLNNTEPATQSLARQDSRVTWLRGGTSPEVWRTTFEVSTDDTNWTNLGAGTRVPGGWAIDGVLAPTNAFVRARGFVTGGEGNGSTWFVESTLPDGRPNPPVILLNDGGLGFRTNRFGFNLRAQPSQAVVIEASTDLVHWAPILTNRATSLGDVMFSDYRSAAFPRRFYRAGLYDGPLPAPNISFADGQPGFQSGSFGFNVWGVSGQSLVIETSTNLVQWTGLITNTLGFLPLYFRDAASPSTPRRFYRVLPQ